MGLLDALQSDEALLGMHLLAAGSAKPVRTSLGEGLLSATQAINQRKAQRAEMEAREEERRQRAAMQSMQMQAMMEQAAARKQAQEQEQQRRNYLGAVDQSAGPALPVSTPRALAAGLSLQEIGALQPPKPADPMAGFDKISPKDYTPESLAAFMQTRNPAVLRKFDKPDLNSLIVLGPDGKPTVNSLLLDAKRQIAKAGATNLGVSYGAPVAGIGPDGKPVYIQPDKMGGAPAIIPGVRPPKSAAEERAESEQATRARQGKQMSEAINAAESILKSGKATASGVGTVMDAGARALGMTTAGAQESAKLQALSGWLVANVPRMEGPQSNIDVLNYTTMAGKVGDSTVPRQERLAALETVKELMQRYADINGVKATQEATQGKVVNFGDLK